VKGKGLVALASFMVALLSVLSAFSFFSQKAQAASLTPHLSENPLLDLAAQLKALDMAKKGYFSHISPEGITPWHWFEQVGYEYAFAGENLAVNFQNVNDLIPAWLNSPSHRENILSSNYTETGVGVARGEFAGQETFFIVQFFGTPMYPMPKYFEKKPMSDLVAWVTRENLLATLRQDGIVRY